MKGHGESHLPAVTCWSHPSLSLLGHRIVYLEKLGLTWAPICERHCEYSLREIANPEVRIHSVSAIVTNRLKDGVNE